MKTFRFKGLTATLVLATALSGCTDFFGKKTKLDFIVPPDPNVSDVSYVPILPDITAGLKHPIAVIAGNDNLLYVVDDSLHHIICFDEAGRELSRMYVPHVHAIAQDRTLDILALGAEAVGDDPDTNHVLPTIYRIAVKNGTYGLGADKIVKKIQAPLIGRVVPQAQDYESSFNGIAVWPDNSYLITRVGPGTTVSSTSSYDAVIWMDRYDHVVTPISISDASGASQPDYFFKPDAIATIPPTSVTISGADSKNFFVTTPDPNDISVLRVREISVNESENGINFTVFPLATTSNNDVPDAIYKPNRFAKPGGVAVARDESRYIFVTDGDSLHQFTTEGNEGVKLTGSSSSRYRKVSFGGPGNGQYQFNDPRGIGYLNRVVYVADAGNGRIVRYKLSSDFQ